MASSEQKPSKDRLEVPAIFAVALAALIIRLLFFSGLSSSEDLVNAQRITEAAALLRSNSGNLLSGLSDARFAAGGVRNLVFFMPYLVVNWFFGVNLFSSLFVSVVCSLANIFLIYSIAKRLFSSSVGLLSATFWAFLPLDITLSTSTLMTTPVTFLAVFSLWLYLENRRRPRVLLFGIAIGAQILVFLIEPWLALGLATLLILWQRLASKKSIRWVFVGIGLVVGLVILISVTQVGEVFLPIYHLLQQQGENLLFLPLFFVATAAILARDPKLANLPLVSIGFTTVALFGKIASNGSPTDTPLIDLGPFLLLLYFSFSLIFGVYFSHQLGKREAIRWVLSLSLTGIVGAALAIRGANKFLPSYEELNWIGLHSLFPLYSVSAGLGFAGIMASPWFLSGSSQLWKQKATFWLLVVIVLASLPFTWDRRNETRYLVEAPASAWEFLLRFDLQGPVFTISQKTQQRFAFVAAASLAPGPRIEQTSVQEIGEGIAFAFENELDIVPAHWVRLGVFGPLGHPRVAVYQVDSIESAQVRLLDLSQADAPLEYYATASNAGLFCEALQAWKLSQPDLMQISSIPAIHAAKCVQTRESLISFEDLIKNKNVSGYITFDRPSQSEGPLVTLGLRQITTPVLNMSTTGILVKLKANTLYLYSMEILTNAESAVLFWKEDGSSDYLEMRAYPNWTMVALLLHTPNWHEGEGSVYFSPVLFDHLEPVSLRNLFLGEVTHITND